MGTCFISADMALLSREDSMPPVGCEVTWLYLKRYLGKRVDQRKEWIKSKKKKRALGGTVLIDKSCGRNVAFQM